MNIINNSYLRKGLILLVVNCALCAQSINATEWQDGIKSKLGFSDFTPPPPPPSSFTNYEDKKWTSGSSFNEENKVRYSPVTSKNPWKPVSSVRYKKSFASQRPWGNVPERKPKNKNSMKFYDQRFKQWSHQQNPSYAAHAYGQSALPFSGAYGYPGMAYNSPLITPSIYPGSIMSTGGYGLYSGRSYPYAGALTRPGLW